MGWTIEFYSEKVRNAVDEWPAGIRSFYARVVDHMKIWGPNLGMPFTRSMSGGLFEIRAVWKEGIGRAFFCTVAGEQIVILHEFIKKSDKTPKKELETARKRLLEVQNEKRKTQKNT
jgi:phage-related protein